MADLTPEEWNDWYGGKAPTADEIRAEVEAAGANPLKFWWDAMSGNKNSAIGRGASAAGIGDHPIRSNNEAGALAASYAIPASMQNGTAWEARAKAGALAAPHENPYSTIVANQARPAQQALYAQMQAQQAGPSVAAMQGDRAQGQNLQAALAVGGGHAVMNQAGQVGAGVAGDTGMGRLAEQLRGSQGLGSMAGGVRGADLGVADASSQAGLQQRGLDDAMRQFYASQGARVAGTNADLANERKKLIALRKLKADQRDLQSAKDFGTSAATTLSAGMG